MKKLIISFFCLSCLISTTVKANPWPPFYSFPLNFLFTQPMVFGDNYPEDADGILIVSQTKFRVVGLQDFNLYGAQCSIYKHTGDTSSKYNFGDITLNDSLVFFLKDSTYKSYGMDLSQDTSFTLKLDGLPNDLINSSTQFTTTKPLINLNSFNLDNIDTNIYRNLPFTYSHPTINADSIIYIFASDSIRIQKKIDGSSSGINFTSAELASLPSSDTGGLFIIIYNVMPAYLNGKKYYFQNNSVAVVSLLHVF